MAAFKATMTIVVEPKNGADPAQVATDYATYKALCQALEGEDCTYDDVNYKITRVRKQDDYTPYA